MSTWPSHVQQIWHWVIEAYAISKMNFLSYTMNGMFQILKIMFHAFKGKWGACVVYYEQELDVYNHETARMYSNWCTYQMLQSEQVLQNMHSLVWEWICLSKYFWRCELQPL